MGGRFEVGLVGEDFAVLEEAFQFDCGGFGGVGGVDYIGHFVVAEVSTDGAFGGGFGVGGAEEVADMGDDVFSVEEKMPFASGIFFGTRGAF